MQLWQQQLLYKQFQEQRQQQFRQLDQETRQLISHSQSSVLGKPATGDQLPATLNDMPTNDAHNYMWPNNFMGDVSNLPINSQMFIPGNMNLAQSNYSTALQNLANGSFILNDQNRAMLSMGFMPQQNDHFIHGMPVSSTGTVDQYPHLLGISGNFNNLMTGPDATLAVKSSYPFATNDRQSAAQGCSQDKTLLLQNLQGRNTLDNPPMQVLGNDVAAGNFLEASNLQFHDQFRELQSRQERDDTLGNLHGKPVSAIGDSRDAAGLDPIEQKLLFGTDEDDNWGLIGGYLTSGTSGEMHGHPLEVDHYGTLPSIHSGSWSALMQEAVQASTSDKGVQEEWSGLSSQTTEPVRAHLPVINGKQPSVWVNDNVQNKASLSAEPFSLFTNSNATPSSSIAGNNSRLLKSAHEENNVPLIEASCLPLRSSLQGINGKEFSSSQNQTKLVESDLKDKIPLLSEMRTGQSIEQCQSRSRNIQLKSQDNGSGWTGQKNLQLSNAPIMPVNNLGGWSTNRAMAFRGDSTSDYHEIHGNHANLNSGTQVKSDIASPKMQFEDYLAANMGSVGNPNFLKWNQNMAQQITSEQKSVLGTKFVADTCGNSEVDNDAKENQSQPNPKLHNWELSRIPATERLGQTFDREKECAAVLSGKGYVGDALKDIVASGGLNSICHGQHTVGPNMVQNSLGNLKNNAEPSSAFYHQLSMQGFSNSVCNRSNTDESLSRSHFAGHVVSSNPMDATEKFGLEAEDLYRNARPACPSSSSFNGSTAQDVQLETISQASNMLELLHKVDQSRDGNFVNASDRSTQVADDVPTPKPHVDWPSNSRGFGLQLAPPSPQLVSTKSPISQNPINDRMIAESIHQGEASYQDQTQSNYTSLGRPLALLHEASERQNWDKISNSPGQQQIKLLEANKYFNSSAATASDFPLVQKQMQEQLGLQRQDHSGAKHHLEQRPGNQISNTSQANVGTLTKSTSLMKQAHDSNYVAVANQSVQTSFSTLPSRISTSGVASHAENHGTGDSQSFSGRGDHTKPTFAGFSQITSSGHQLPALDTRSVSQSSISGMSQQAGVSTMLHNVWTNISVQRQASINPLLTPNVLHSLINHGRERISWSTPKSGGQVNKKEGTHEVGTSSNSQKDENAAQVKFSNLIADKMDGSNAKNVFHGEETVPKPAFDRGSTFPVSSLVHLHQHDVNKANNEQLPAVNLKDLHSTPTTAISSGSVIVSPGGISKPSDHQPQNYSLLHQIQSLKASDSDINKLTGNLSRGASFGSNTQMNLNVNQTFDHGQNSISKYPDIKVGAAAQILYPSDTKMLSFASNDNEEKNLGTSTAGQGILQTHMHPHNTSSIATALGGTDCPGISPQMDSWVEQHATYQNGTMVPPYDAQMSGKASTHQYFREEVPARMEDSALIDQRLESTQSGGYEQGTLSTKISPNESSSLLLSDTIYQPAILRPKKRKSMAVDLPWHRIVTERPQSLESISMADLDWNLVANRLIEKIDDDAEALEDDPLIPHSRRRLIQTTQLMHQLVPAVPSPLLKDEAASAYESVPFALAKSVLAHACSLVSFTRSDSHEPVENENVTLDHLRTSKVGDDTYSKLVENFIGRSEKLGANFSRLETGTSLLELRMECQELERFSIVNRLGKFHGRTHTDIVEVSAARAVHHRTFAQRQITAVSMPGNLPEGVMSLSL
ncbi:uncharacterized protein LOC122017012 [Zingiber officinale]|uniref:Uncharacterized protein n=1 Tax=Zingiber officinale TaxID=94328 RepID=A0A8J5LUG1_ZINOF|nr:uncharacterized protein LOC122017012 [Zingiber officinale]XP_042430412.1 uncharacterized protein LOC122017012 [Zingiber officinale]KAG6535443.1 hypothetical protein ZIOFF_000415 [Zingiber officinale]